MKYFRRKVYFSILAGILLLVTALSSTYAWITLNRSLSAGTIKLNMVSGEGIQISLDGKNFVSYIDEESILKEIKKQSNQTNDKLSFRPMSPANSTNLNQGFSEIRKFPSDGEHKTSYYDLDYNTSGAYIKFDLYFTTNLDTKLDENNNIIGTDIYFTSSDMFESNPYEYHMARDFTHSSLGPLPRKIKTSASNAMRVGAMVYDTVNINDTYAANKMSELNSTIFYVGDDTPSINDEGVYNFGGLGQDNIAKRYFESVCATDITSLDKNGALNRVDQNIRNGNIISGSRKLLNKKMVKVRFFIWLEGWDPDCLDSAYKQDINISLKFTSYVD